MAKAVQLPEWDLSDLYSAVDSPKLTADLKKAERECAAFAKLYGACVAKLSGDELAAAIKKYEAVSDLLGKIASYAQLVYSKRMDDPKILQAYQNISEKVTEISSQTLFFTLAINRIDDKQIKTLLRSKALTHYAPWLRDIRSFRPYQLSDELEKLLYEKSVTGRSAWNRLFDETIAALRFTVRGKTMTSAEALHLLSDKDAKLRHDAALEVGNVFSKNASTFAFITNTLAKDKEIEDRWRGFARPISSRNVSNYIEDEVVEALIQTVRKNYPKLSHRYYKLKAKWLGKKQLDYWDRNAPLPFDADRSYGWNEAKELVLSSYKQFSPTLAKTGEEFFKKSWIDAPVTTGKAPGAFAHPVVPSVHPYLLVNFMGKARDVMTLAHELGHGVHQVYSAAQGALMSDTPLTLAETASVFGEQLTFREMLRRETNAKRRTALLASKVEDMLNTVVRQVAFCEFERVVHDERKKGEVPVQRLCDIWMQVQRESLGPSIKIGGNYQYYWAYIPHFIHSPFYVYAYAFGDCLVNSLYGVYLKSKDKKSFEKKYLAMLEAGGTLRHKELLAPFGLDASKPTFWQQGLDVIEEFIDELD